MADGLLDSTIHRVNKQFADVGRQRVVCLASQGVLSINLDLVRSTNSFHIEAVLVATTSFIGSQSTHSVIQSLYLLFTVRIIREHGLSHGQRRVSSMSSQRITDTTVQVLKHGTNHLVGDPCFTGTVSGNGGRVLGDTTLGLKLNGAIVVLNQHSIIQQDVHHTVQVSLHLSILGCTLGHLLVLALGLSRDSSSISLHVVLGSIGYSLI